MKGSIPEDFITIGAVSGEELMWRWEELKSRIEQEISDLCDTAADKTVREICAEQEALFYVQSIMEELENK
jgi:hypothetical protein